MARSLPLGDQAIDWAATPKTYCVACGRPLQFTCERRIPARRSLVSDHSHDDTTPSGIAGRPPDIGTTLPLPYAIHFPSGLNRTGGVAPRDTSTECLQRSR